MADFIDEIKKYLGQTIVTGTPMGWVYGGIDYATGGKLPGAFPTPEESRAKGAPKSMPDGDIKYWTGTDYGYQSGESYKKLTGGYPSGYKPAPTMPAPAQAGTSLPPISPVPSDTGSVPPPAPLPPSSAGASIPQKEDKGVQDMLGTFKGMLTPEYIAQIERIRNRSAVERSLVTSLLAQQQTKEKSRRDLETENIRAWRDIQQARINANATQAAALATAIWASSQVSPTVIQESYKAALTPYQNFRLK